MKTIHSGKLLVNFRKIDNMVRIIPFDSNNKPMDHIYIKSVRMEKPSWTYTKGNSFYIETVGTLVDDNDNWRIE